MLIVIFGTGSIGRRHIANLQTLVPNVRFIFVREKSRKDNFSRSLDAQVVENVSSAIELKPDAAVISTPSSLHVEVIPDLLAAAIPFYVEKPVAASQRGIEILREALRSHPPLTTLVGCNLRYLPSLRLTRELLLSDRIGTVIRASFQAGQWLPDWRPNQDYRTSYSASPELGGGVIMDLIHELDAVRWFFGEFEEIHAVAGHRSSLEIRTEDAACILLSSSSNNPLVTVALDYVARPPIRRYEFFGEKGTLVWNLPDRCLTLNGRPLDNIEKVDKMFDVSFTYVEAMKEFLSCIASGQTSSQDIYEGLKSAELAIRIKEEAGLC